jgi:hypothetical protein
MNLHSLFRSLEISIRREKILELYMKKDENQAILIIQYSTFKKDLGEA